MSKLLLPDARFRSPTAVDGKSDMRDENVYSALVVAGGATGSAKVFTVPQGQGIPQLKAAAVVIAPAHQLTYTQLTTNLTKAGELGSGLGDASIRAIGISIENQWISAAGAPNTYGAGNQEVNEILSKCSFELKIGAKKQIEGALFMFPSSGGAFGSISTSEATVTASQLTNGWPGTLRRLKLPILIGRQDALEGVFAVAGSSSLNFTDNATNGQSSLVWFNLHALMKGDVR